MNKILYILCGVPGSGKSTFAKTFKDEPNVTWISRDTIRFNLIGENAYFSKEQEVYNTYCSSIVNAIKGNADIVIADATHLNPKSRQKLISRLTEVISMVEVIAIDFKETLNTCLERNALRVGRERVPEDRVTSMYYTFVAPNLRLERYLNQHWTIEDGNITIVRKRHPQLGTILTKHLK